ncbi:hypothetical protein BGZ46_000361 [Entomortierella lignicola]|nr:hypothetical protein BGZ46_000361 [Entomortierella lignicola]
MSAAAHAAKKAPTVFQTWFPWYVTRLARGPDVTWDRRNNPHPWLNIDQETQLKLMTVKEGQGFTKTYSRDRL